MKVLYLIFTILLFNCSFKSKKPKTNDFPWYLITKNVTPEKPSRHGPIYGYTSGYVNKFGDTIIPLDKYARCFTDTAKYFAIVQDKKGETGLIGIDQNQKKLFNAVWMLEPVPVELNDGMLLIIENRKYGFANEKGEIVIEPQFKCAECFSKGKAKVSNDCEYVKSETKRWKMNSWFYINKQGKKIN